MGSPDRVYQCSLVFALATIMFLPFVFAHDHERVGWFVLLEMALNPLVEVFQVLVEKDPILFVEDVPHY
jgi:hypothetical protein